jgi:predicted Zn-dependent protease
MWIKIFQSGKSYRKMVLFMAFAFVMGLTIVNSAAADQIQKLNNGITFSYPSGWTAKELKKGSAVILTNPQDKDTSISIIVIDGVISNSLPANEAEWLRKTKGQNVELTSFKKDTVAGVDAIRVEYLVELKKSPHYSRAMYLQKNGSQINISLGSRDKSKLEATGPVFEAVIGSLAFD